MKIIEYFEILFLTLIIIIYEQKRLLAIASNDRRECFFNYYNFRTCENSVYYKRIMTQKEAGGEKNEE